MAKTIHPTVNKLIGELYATLAECDIRPLAPARLYLTLTVAPKKQCGHCGNNELRIHRTVKFHTGHDAPAN